MTTMDLHVLSRMLRHADSILKSAYLAFALTMLGWILRSGQSAACWILIALSMLVIALQHYIAIRVRFDADLLAHVARLIDSGSSERGATKMLDDSLMRFGWMPASKAGRDWGVRFKGCLRLFRIQVGLLILQYLLMIATLVVCTAMPL